MNNEEKKSYKGRIGLGVIIVVVVLILLFLGTLTSFITDYLWFKDLGYTQVFFKKLMTQLQLGVPTFLIVTVLATVYLMLLKRNYYNKIETTDNDDFPKSGGKITILLALVFGLIVTLSTVTSLWKEILYFTNSTSFGTVDPIFDHDISFYVFKLVLLNQLTGILLGLVIAFIALTLVYYVYLMSVSSPKLFGGEGAEPGAEAEFREGQINPNDEQDEYMTGPFGIRIKKMNQTKRAPYQHKLNKMNLEELLGFASTQLIVLGIFFCITVCLDFVLRQYSLLFSYTETAFGAGYTDIHITLWVYRIMAVLAIVAAFIFILGMKQRKYKKILIVPAIMILLSFAGGGIAMGVQNLLVSPDELNKEYPYLKNNIEYTQKAYNLTEIESRPFAATATLTSEDILNNLGTINNIRINDYLPTEQFYNQTQSIRTYYRFNDVDVDRYMLNGEYTQVFLSAREIDETKIDNTQWLTQHIKYTHGYGITLSRVDEITATGQPKMIINSIPPVSSAEEIQISRPEIYFGELTDNYIITNTTEPEFDYPSGSTNTYTEYKGAAGINLTLPNRILFAVKEQNPRILVSTNITKNSRMIYNRNIMERVLKIAPFFAYDEDPYIVVSDEGRLYWIIDGYTTSSNYPYSTPYSEETSLNYIRNSVKVLIDAYNGTVEFYQIDKDDPIATTIGKIYPGLMKDFSEMPADLQKHVRYPDALFEIQARVYQRFHMKDVGVFYQNEDMWAIANEIYGTSQQSMSPNYYIMKIPGEKNEEFISSIPFTPRDKNNMTGLLIARNDGDNYGQLILYRLSKDRIFYGPMQIEAIIDQNPEISKEFSLWNSAGSKYIRGNMFVIPVENSLIYVEPVYLEASNENSLPEVKRVIVAYGDRVAYEPTLAAALDSMFGSGTDLSGNGGGTGDDQDSDDDGFYTKDELIKLANEAFTKATEAQKSGDWKAYGEYLQLLHAYLTELSTTSGVSSTESSAEIENLEQNDIITEDQIQEDLNTEDESGIQIIE